MTASRRVLLVLAVLGGLVALVGLISYYRAPGSLYPLAISAFQLYFMLGSVAGAVLFAFLRGRTGWIGLACCVAMVLWTIVVRAPYFVATTVPPGRDITVLTANLRIGSASPQRIVQLVRSNSVDVAMLEELTPSESSELTAAGLRTLLPYGLAHPAEGGAGTALLSKYPVHDAAVDPAFPFAFISGRVAVPGFSPAPTMVALHLYGPYPSAETPFWRQDIARVGPVLQHLPTDAPVIVGGDFNAPPSVPQFRALLTGGYADAAEQAGAGLTPTYPANRLIPLIAIDHVLTRGAVAHRADSVSLDGSDHRGLVVTVRLPTG